MIPFTFIRTKDKETAIRDGSVKGAKFIAGGTNLVDLMKLDIEKPEKLVDINSLELKQIEVLSNGHIRVGALVKNSAFAYHPEIMKRFPVISEAILSGASPQLRNMASTGGNILQRTRCYYFYDTAFACNKREPGSGCSAISGYNRNHAILGTSDHCIATHPSDLCVALMAMDTIILTQGPKGKRTIPFTEFYRMPGNMPHIENVLQPGELITAIEIPALNFSNRSCYLKVRDRASYEFALTSAAVALDISGGKIVQSRIALGGVGTKPWRASEAEKQLAGSAISEQVFQKAAGIAVADAKLHQHNAFKKELSKRTLVRALMTASEIA
jgi:xanthine dehydrogenase YagS FAD-binding subunit